MSLQTIKSLLNKTIIVSIFIILISCGEKHLISTWKYAADSANDWRKDITFIKDEGAALVINNDADNIYLHIATADRAKIVNVLRMGLTIWFEPQAGDGQTIGIQYPVKSNKVNPEMMREMRKKVGDENVLKQRIENLKYFQNEFLVVDENNFPLYAYPLKNNVGIEIETEVDMGQFVYYLKIPLLNGADKPVAVNAFPGSELRIGFETGKMERTDFGGRGEMSNNGSRPPMGGARGGGRPGSGNSGMGRRGDQQRPGKLEPIEFWIDVKLAEQK